MFVCYLNHLKEQIKYAQKKNVKGPYLPSEPPKANWTMIQSKQIPLFPFSYKNRPFFFSLIWKLNESTVVLC